MPNRNMPHPTHGNGPSETFARARSRPQKYKNVLEFLGTPSGTCSPAQPRPGPGLGFAACVGACLFPEPGHSRRVCLADQGSLESGLRFDDMRNPRLWGPLHS